MKRIFSFILVLMAMQMVHATIETFKVTNVSVSGSGSIGTAIESAVKSTADTAQIVFEFDKKGTKVINLDNTLKVMVSTPKVVLFDGSSTSDSVIFDGGAKSFTGFYLSYKNVTFKNLTFRNFDQAINNYNSTLNLYDCEFTDNKTGVYLQDYSDIIDACVFGNNEIGIDNISQLKSIKNCYFGLSRDEKVAQPNQIGLYVRYMGNITDFENNIVSANKIGIKVKERCSIKSIKSCFFGVDSQYQAIYKDKKSGYVLQDTAIVYTSMQMHTLNIDKCFFGLNSLAVRIIPQGTFTLNLSDSRFGVTPTFEDVQNSHDISCHSTNSSASFKGATIENCTFGYTTYTPLHFGSIEELNLINNNFGGDGLHYFPFKDYDDERFGVVVYPYRTKEYCRNLVVKDNIFSSNNGVSVDHVYKPNKSLFSGNLFFNTYQNAYVLPYEVSTPKISSVVESGDYILVSGSTDSVATVELFFTDQTEQTAIELVSTLTTKADGSFSAKFPKTQFEGKRSIGFTATATYDETHTSTLSKVAYLKEKEIDLTRLEYFVKIDGDGDGSSWSKAMSPNSFAYYVSKVKDGATFYVAEGTYNPSYDYNMKHTNGKDASFTVNSDITIKGGYPADAKDGDIETRDPAKHPTVFSGDFMGNDELVFHGDPNRSPKAYFKNDIDDCSTLFLVKPSVKYFSYGMYGSPNCTFDEEDTDNSFVLDGVTIKGASLSILGVGQNLVVTISNSSFENSGSFYLLNTNPSLIVENTKFKNSIFGQLIDSKMLKMKDCTIDNCFGHLFLSAPDTETRTDVDFESVHVNRGWLTYEFQRCDITANDFVIKNANYPYISMYNSNARFDNSSISYNKGSYLFNFPGSSLSVNNSSFINNEFESYLFYGSGLNIDNSYFDYNKVHDLSIISYGSDDQFSINKISNSTFVDNKNEEYLFLDTQIPFYFENNTVVDNSANILFNVNSPHFYNNTILGNSVANNILMNYVNDIDEESTELIGNIILGNGSISSEIGYSNLPVIKTKKNNIQNNLMTIIRSDYQKEGEADNTTWIPENSSNIFVRPFDLGTDEASLCTACASAYPEFEDKVLSQLFDGRYNTKKHTFSPNLDDDGDLPVARLKTSRLEDGTDLLFPLKNTNVKTDELGAERTPYTSMGAVEKSCVSDTTFVTDTFSVGTKFEGVTYNTIGIYDNIKVNKKNIYGCDSVVNHKLIIVPDTKIKEFYVKTKATGTGDGSDWDNAMSAKDFAFVFNNSTVEGITYYLAAGVYYPVYNGLGVEKNDRNAYWSTKHGANIYGGYDSLATGDASTTKADPSLYRTIFSGDFNNDDEIVVNEDGSYYINNLADDVNYNLLTMDITEDVHISGVEFRGMTYSRGTSPAVVYIHSSENSKANVLIDYCKFSTADKGVNVYSVGDVKIDNCEFDHLLNSAIGVEGNTYVSNSTFNYTNGINFYGTTSEFTLENSTFTNNAIHLTLSYGYSSEPFNVKAKISNNTFINGVKSGFVFVYDHIDAEFTGNIFAGTSISVNKSGEETSTQTFANNLFAYKSLDLGETGTEKNNITLEDATELYTTILDGTYSAEDGVFTPNLTKDRGYTRTVALLKDELSSGEVLRLKAVENITTDQRGVKRPAYTNMGAFEYKCKKPLVFVNDTIIVGTKPVFKDSVYNTIGRYDGILDTIDVNGCDSIVVHRLFVIPNPKNLNYYVKMDKEGKGDGSDWDNAMDGEDFAFCLPLAPNGATFHVAAGTYKPIYSYSLSTLNSRSFAFYEIRSSVTIRGGYSTDGKGKTAKWDPKKYNTVFDGDIEGDDKIDMSNDEDGYPKLTKINTEDNTSRMFESVVNEEVHFTLEGVVLRNTTGYAIVLVGYKKNLTLRHDSIYSVGGISNQPITGSGLNILDCKISNVNADYLFNLPYNDAVVCDSVILWNNRYNYAFYAPCCLKTQVKNSRFEDNVSGPFIYTSVRTNEPVNVDLHNCSVINNNGGWFYLHGTNFSADSCLFENNSGSILFDITTPSKYCFINKSKFIKNSYNKLLYETSDSVAVENTLFDNNIVGTLLYGYTSSKRYFANNTFINNEADSYLVGSEASGAVSKLVNNTISKNVTGNAIIHLYDHPMYFYNNTIVGNRVNNKAGAVLKCDFYHSWADLYGNIILGNAVPEGKTEYLAIRGESKKLNNILTFSVSDTSATGPNDPRHCHESPDASNVISVFDPSVIDCDDLRDYVESVNKNPGDVLSALFEGTYDKKTNLFTPVIDYYGGFTPTIALKKDKLADGTSIRFPISATIAIDDQRGVERLDLTCMGAYEMSCGDDTTFVVDTIVVGTEFMDSVYTEIGRHDSIIKVFKTKLDCDSVVNYTLFVTPDPNVLNYYVKTKRTGKGDGSDWDNAMSGEDFTFSLPYAPSGATFYVAEGTYKPIYTYTTPTSVKTYVSNYEIKNDVTIRGGYSADATTKKALYDPKKYPTIFDRDDIRYSLFVTYSNDELHIVLDGVSVINSGTAFYLMNPDKKLKISNSKFSNNGSCVYMPYSGDELEVFNSEFTKHTSTVIEMPQASVLIMDSVLFDNNAKRLINIPTTSGVNPGYNVKLNRLFAYSNGDSSAIIYSIGHDFLLTNSEFKNNKGMFYILDNTRIDSTVFENNYGSITKYGVLGFEINECSFVDNNCKGSFIYTAKNGDEFNHFSVTNSSFKNIDSEGLLYVVTDSINLSHCEISGSKQGTCEFNSDQNVTINECNIYDNNNSYFHFVGSDIVNLMNNSFWKNDAEKLLDFDGIENTVIINNTIVSNTCTEIMDFSGGNRILNNNTVVGNVASSYIFYGVGGSLDMSGNIVLSNKVKDESNKVEHIYLYCVPLGDFYNNMLPCIGTSSSSTSDSYCHENSPKYKENLFSFANSENSECEYFQNIPDRNEEILTTLFEGTYDSETGLFTPVIDESGFTAVVALKKDALSDGTSIRFPRLENVLTDQRGVERLDLTCMGAYEMRCGDDTTFVVDTIVVGTEFMDSVYTEIGRHDSIIKVYKSKLDCDSVVNYTLFVTPDPNVLNYYVKTKRTGKGDGSDWDNAMNGEDFAAALSLAPKGAVFYVAEGSYRPKYDAYLSVPEIKSNATYKLNDDVSIRGGYPADATGTDIQSDPKKNLTIFDGDIQGDDIIKESLDKDGYYTFDRENGDDNVINMFLSLKKDNQNLVFDGIVVKNVTSNAAFNILYPDKNVVLKNDSFVHNNTVLQMPYEGDIVDVSNTSFSRNLGRSIYAPDAYSVILNNVSFDSNSGDLLYTTGNEIGNVEISNVTSTNNKGQFYIHRHHLSVDSSHFENSYSRGLFYVVGNGYDVDCQVHFKNSKFINIEGGSVLDVQIASALDINNCLLSNNKCGSYNLVNFNGGKDVSIRNSNFVNNEFESISLIGSGTTLDFGTVVIDSCVIESSIANKSLLYIIGFADNAVLSNCSVNRNNFGSGIMFFSSIKSLLINNNSFTNNEGGDLITTVSGTLPYFTNNTFASNKLTSTVISSDGSKSTLYNNTIVGNQVAYNVIDETGSSISLLGNIILGNASENYGERIYLTYGSVGDVLYNIIPEIHMTLNSCKYEPDPSNIVSLSNPEKAFCENFQNIQNRNEEILTTLFEGTYDSETGLFTPVIDESGFTAVVALKKDALSDGTSIRFPRLENVLTDQRGVERLDSTCMGAYEMRCGDDTTFVVDTIVVGTEFMDSVYTEIGRHDSIIKVYKSKLDCDSVVNYTLFVTPDPNALNYYVKTKRTGKGDGSDWDNAMNGDDFAAALPLAPEGAVFYVAEGSYKPIYSTSLSKPTEKSTPLYEINSSLAINGGYPSDATGTDVPSNPKKFKTIFDGDIDGENKTHSMFLSLSNEELHITFDGVSVRNSNYGLNILNPDKKLKVSNSEFSNNNTPVNLPYNGDELEVYNSEFSKNLSTVIDMPQASVLKMDSVLFDSNARRLINIPAASGVNPGYNVRLNRLFAYSNGDSSEIIYSIGHDFLLTNSEFKNNKGMFYLLDNTRIDSTVFENNYGSITKYGVLGFEINESSFLDHNCNGTLINTAKNGSEFNHFSITNSSFKNIDSKGLLYVVTDSVNIDSSLFANSTNGSIWLNNYQSANFSRSHYTDNKNAYLYFNGGSVGLYENLPTIFYGNTVSNNEGGNYLFEFTSGADSVVIANNTIVSNVSSNLIEFSGCEPEMYNNTILGNTNESYTIFAYPGNLKMEGNIILGNSIDSKEDLSTLGTECVFARWSNIDYKNNILPCIVDMGDYQINEISQSILDNNIFSIFDKTKAPEELKNEKNRNQEILTYLFDGKYNSKTGLFTPELTDKGVLTPVVVLKKNTLADGTTITFPRLANILKDQREEARFDSTCMGAYEMNCDIEITKLKDTILVGEPYTYREKNLDEYSKKVGSYIFTDTLITAAGCDSVIRFTLAVRPEKRDGGYYVKTKAQGDGSGIDWENAMSAEDFANYLPLVYDGDTFHIAEGNYSPMVEIEEIGLGYEFGASVALVGGYPDTVKSLSTPSQPDLYVTKITSDVENNDYLTVYNYLDYSSEEKKLRDNTPALLYSNGKHDIYLYGITLSGEHSCELAAVEIAESSLKMERCNVEKNIASIVRTKGDVIVDKSYFHDNVGKSGSLFDLDGSKLSVVESAFERNIAENICGEDPEIYGVFNLNDASAEIVNSTFSLNRSAKGGLFNLVGEASGDLNLINNTIVGSGNSETGEDNGSVIYVGSDSKSIEITNSIIAGNGATPFASATGVSPKVSSKHNICDVDHDWMKGTDDMHIETAEMSNVLDGEPLYSKERYFAANLRLGDGVTPTVAVISSGFSGGKVMSVLLEDRAVDTDQRGFIRKDTSCVGSYEFPTYSGYYVTKTSRGDGTGRDWANSMSDTTFSKYFPIVPTGATFHVAAGTYKPMHDNYGKLSKALSRNYYTTRPLNIIGGYPADAKDGDVSDPKNNETIFSVDYNNDDEIVDNGDSYYFENRSDNGHIIMNISSKIDGSVRIHGVTFKGNVCPPKVSNSALCVNGYNSMKIEIDSCKFENNYCGASLTGDSIFIYECTAENNSRNMSLSSRSEKSDNILTISKSTFSNSNSGVSTYFNGKQVVENSTFVDNVTSFSASDSYAKENMSSLTLRNNTFSSKTFSYTDMYLDQAVPTTMIANIFNLKKATFASVYGATEPTEFASDYNIYTSLIDASETVVKLGKNDKLVTPEELSNSLEGTYDELSGIFHAKLDDNGGFTKTVAILNTKISDEVSVKMIPSSAKVVVDDQCDTERDEVSCAGSFEADCHFKDAIFKLELANETICRDDTALVNLTGVTDKEKKLYKFAWTSTKDSVYVVDTFGNPGKFHVYARQASVPFQMTITNACDNDTVLEIMQNVNGVGSVPFDGIEEGEVFCQAESKPVLLTTAVDGASFSGECIVKKGNDYYFDASKAKGDSTRVRCSIQDGDCRSFDEKTIKFFKFEGDSVVNIESSTETKNVCMQKPQAQSEFTVKGWRDGLTCKLVGPESTTADSIVTKDSVLTITYGSLKNGDYVFTVYDECKSIATKDITIENEEIDPKLMKLKLDTVVANTSTCDGGELGDVRVEYSGNVNNADVIINLSSKGTLVKSDTLSAEKAYVLFDNLKPALYDVKIFFDGMEECTSGDDNYTREINVTLPVKFEVAFSATKAICEGSKDAMMFTKTSGGNTPYTYKWTKYVDNVEKKTITHEVELHDTLPNLVKNEVYVCNVVDNYGCEAASDTLKIIYDHADSTLIDTFIYDPYQRCKGVNNSQMIVDFSVVSEYAKTAYTLSKLGESNEYEEIKNSDTGSKKILLDNLAPGKYKLHVGYPSDGCPSLMDTMVEIKELINDFKFEKADSVRMPRCYANNDAAIYFHAIGASRGLTATLSYKKGGEKIADLSIDSLAGDTAFFVADNLPNDSFVVKMKNVCEEEISYEYKVGAPDFGIEMVDSISFKMLKCRYDSTGIIAFHINTGAYDSTKVTLRYNKPERVTRYYTTDKIVEVQIPVYKFEQRVKDTIWSEDSLDFDVRYERDPVTNEIIVDTLVTYETKDSLIKEQHSEIITIYKEAVFPCKFDTVYGKDTTFIYSHLPGGSYFIDLVSTIKGCKDSLRYNDTIKVPNSVQLNYQVLDISCMSKTDGVISLKPRRVGGGDPTFVLKHDSTIVDGKYEYEICYIGHIVDGAETTNLVGDKVTEKLFQNYTYKGYPLMTRLNRISNMADLYKKDGDKYIQIQKYEIDDESNGLKKYLFGQEWKSIKWRRLDDGGIYRDFAIITPDSTTYEEDVYYSGADTIKTAVWSYTHLSNYWKDEYGEWLESGVQTIANLPKGYYDCTVTDTNNCVYNTSVVVREPENPLRIREVVFNANDAVCDPTMRHIDMEVDGGWGDYNYMVMDDKPIQGKGGVIDNYLAATSVTYDTLNKIGYYRSQFLDPGKYRVAVVDAKGCRIESDGQYEVKTSFTVEGSVKDALCPGEESAPATFVIHDDSTGYKYAVKEHIGTCDSPYECIDSLNFYDCDVEFASDGKTFTKKITGGGHGFFIYRVSAAGDTSCGTYVRVSAVDTLKPMSISKKSIKHVTCNGLADGEIELYILGGKAPYVVDVNPSWGSKDIDTTLSKLYPVADPKDTVGFPCIKMTNLKARDYYFRITDYDNCHQYFGDTAIGNHVLKLKEPDPLTADFIASSMCANSGTAGDPNYGSVQAINVKGGTAPYMYNVTGGLDINRELANKKIEHYSADSTSDVSFIAVAGYGNTDFHYTITDANNCTLSEDIQFGKDTIKALRQTEFLATTWSHYGDVIALIDFCGPESTFDSVSYSFSNPKVKMLDKRMYIYDLDKLKRGANKNAKQIVLQYHDTREVPDYFFYDNFELAENMTTSLAAHINFITVTDKDSLYKKASHSDSIYLKTNVTMSSYFKGCRYQVEINDFLKVAYDNVDLYFGGVDKRKDILDIVITPNPRVDGQSCEVKVYLANNTSDLTLSMYHMDGSVLLDNKVPAKSELFKETTYDYNDAYVYTFTIDAENSAKFNNVEVIVVSARTQHDSKGTVLLNEGIVK